MAEYITIRRWALKEGVAESALVDLVRDGIIPAYKKQPGCLRLTLLRVNDPPSYLAMTHWESKAAYDRWAGDDGQSWRDEYRPTLERWLEIMSFQDEWETELVISSD
jgi:heme-degrading monooxygenase HmoA